MKCPLCNDDVDRNLAEMETHLKEVHELDENDLEQFGDFFSYRVQAQIDLEKRTRERQRMLDILLLAIGVGFGFYLAYLVGWIWP